MKGKRDQQMLKDYVTSRNNSFKVTQKILTINKDKNT